MPPRLIPVLCFLGLLLPAIAPARAQTPANLEANFAPSLTITYNTGGTVRPLKNGAEETSNQFRSFTVTSREILSDLIYHGRIQGPLAGWKLIGRARASEAMFLNYRLFAVKAGQPDYPFDTEEFSALDVAPSFVISKVKDVLHADGHYTGAGTVRYYISGNYAFADYDLYVAGHVSAPYSYKVLTVEGGKVSVLLPSTVTAKVGGGETYPEENDASVTAAGSLKFSGHRILSLIATE